MSFNFKVITFNCEGTIRNKNCIKHVIDTHNPDVLCIQETWLLNVKLLELEAIDNSYTVKCK